ncbi:hypothetical protein AB6A40_006805 [Gnathostoma spinigerum]|uniref:Pyridoxine-5'-phosphate oxidase n=1 Tax=Gnathostoma spinigerum TaxID=75299 RepID=A0ABD6ERL7_9BILA
MHKRIVDVALDDIQRPNLLQMMSLWSKANMLRYFGVSSCRFIAECQSSEKPRSVLTDLTMSDFGIEIKDWRRTYLNKNEPFLLEENLPSKDPFDIFDVWFKNVAEQADMSFEEVNAVCFSTAINNRPSSRMVLMKEYDREGFSFYTNYESRKGKEILANPFASMLFYWPKADRQIRIEGKVEKLSEEAADNYWKTRPLKSRIGSKLSKQSTEIPSRQHLISLRDSLQKLADEKGLEAISRPTNWGGYRLRPDYFEFWQGQSDRIHDRIVFIKTGDKKEGWTMKRLAP